MDGENRKQILLVEDESIIALTQKMLLEKYDYSVITASSGEKALELFKENDWIDLVLMDINLGTGLDGPETAMRMLTLRKRPIVFLSSHTEPEIVEKTEKITSYGYVVKNSGITVLDASIKMAFKLFHAHNEIENSEVKQKTMISHISDVIAIIDADGIVKYMSSNVENWFGWKPENLLNTDSALKVHADDRERVRKIFSSLLESENATVTMEYLYLCKNGFYKPIELSATNLVHDPVIGGLLLNYHDISDRRYEEEELASANGKVRESEDKFRLLVTSMDQGLALHEIIIDADGKPVDYVFIDINESYTRLLGVTREMAIGKRIREVMPKVEEYWIDIFGKVALTGESSYYENYLETTGKYYSTYSYCPKKNQFAVLVSDITERKLEEKKLSASENRYRRLFETAQVGILILDAATGMIVDVNQFLIALLGYTHESFLGKTIWDIGFLKDVIGNTDKFRELQEKKYVRYENLPLETASGAIIEVEFVSNVYLIDREKVIQCNIRDVSDRKRAEIARQESEDKYRLLADNMTDLLTLHSPDGKYLYLSPSCSVLTGYSPDELVGTDPYQLFHPDDIEAIRHSQQTVLETAGSFLVEYRIRHKDGHYFWIETNNRTIRDEQTHEVTRIICISRDVSERKKIEEALQEKNRELDRYFSSALDLLCIADTGGHFIRVNPEWESVLGYNISELEGRLFLDFVHPDDMEVTLKAMQKLAAQNQILNFENRYRCKDGSYRWIEWRAHPVGTQIYAAARDITAHKKAEDKIRELLDEKELILKEVHHRIKNNMNTIKCLLSMQASLLTDPAAVCAMKDSENRVESMALLYDFLYKSESFNEMSVALYLPSLIDRIIDNFPNRKIVTVEKKIDDFVLDVKKLQPLGILVNELLTNIMKYAFTDHKAGLITLTVVLTGDDVTLSLADDGNGIPESVSFEHSPGFGLELVKGITRQLNGTIRIERGNGTVIVLKFRR